jgi:hypothetical protein
VVSSILHVTTAALTGMYSQARWPTAWLVIGRRCCWPVGGWQRNPLSAHAA